MEEIKNELNSQETETTRLASTKLIEEHITVGTNPGPVKLESSDVLRRRKSASSEYRPPSTPEMSTDSSTTTVPANRTTQSPTTEVVHNIVPITDQIPEPILLPVRRRPGRPPGSTKRLKQVGSILL